jgi:hypothetical protein
MKFFTPQLYQQFNSPNGEEADRADEQWEQALRGYQKYLSEIRDRLPSQIIKLSELDLHDAESSPRVRRFSPHSTSRIFQFHCLFGRRLLC